MSAKRPDNPYDFFLKIAADGRTPDHYELLGLPRFTDDATAIKQAAIQRSTELRGWDNSDYHLWSNKLLDEVVAAILILESPAARAEYDRDLRQSLERASIPSALPLADTTASPAVPDFIPAEPQDVGSRLEQITRQEISNDVTTQSNTMARAPLPNWMRWSAAGCAVVLLVGVGWFITSKSTNREPAAVTTEQTLPEDPLNMTEVEQPSTDSVTNRPQFEVGKPVDLLKQIEVSRDVVAGYWRFEQEKLLTNYVALKEAPRLQVPYSLPEEYVLDVTAERTGERDLGLSLGFVTGGRQGMLAIDGFDQPGPGVANMATALELIGGVRGNKNSTAYSRGKRLLPLGEPQSFSIEVRKTGVLVRHNQSTIIDWEGRPEEFSAAPSYQIPNRQALMLAAKASFTIHEFTLTPLSETPMPVTTTDYDHLATGKWLPLIDATTVLTDPKQMKLTDGILELDRKTMEFPNIVARDVIVRAQVRKLSGQNLGIQLRNTKGVGYYGGWYNGGDDFGIGKSGKKPWADLQAGRIGREFKPGDFVEMTVSVVGDSFALYVDGRQVYSFQDKELDRGIVSISALNGKSLFKDMEYQILDTDTPTKPNVPSANTGTAKEPVSVPSVTKIPADAKSFNNYSYKFYGEKLTWKDAKAKCESMGGNLVIIDSAEENKFVGDLVANAGWHQAWIGITDEVREGTWLTVTGQPVSFTNWLPPEPDNWKGKEDFALMSNREVSGKQSAWQWHDQSNQAETHLQPGFVCEWNQAGTASGTSPISTPLPKSDYDAIATGKWVRLVDASTKLPDPKSMKFTGGVLELNDALLTFPQIDARDVILRAKIQKLSGENVGLIVRDKPVGSGYSGHFKTDKEVVTGKVEASNAWRELKKGGGGRSVSGYFELAFSAVGDKLTLYVDGREIHSHRDTEWVRGAVAIKAHQSKGLFKDVEVMVLDSTVTTGPGSIPSLWTPLRTSGVSNSKHEAVKGGWTFPNGEVLCDTKESGWLRSDGEYGDFQLDLEFKLAAKANGGVLIRHKGDGPLDKGGMEINLFDENSATRPEQRSGAIAKVMGPQKSALKKLGEWNVLQVVCREERVTVTLNDQKTVDTRMEDHVELKSLPRKGYLGLSNIGGLAKGIAFRNVKVSPLKWQVDADKLARWIKSPHQIPVTRSLAGHTKLPLKLAFSRDGSRLLSASEDGTLRFWNTTSAESLVTLKEHKGAVTCCALSADGKFALSGGEDDTVRWWNVDSGTAIAELKGHGAPIYAVAFDSNSLEAVSVASNNSVYRWSLSGKKEVARFTASQIRGFGARPDVLNLLGASFTGNARQALIPGYFGAIHLIDMKSQTEVGQFGSMGFRDMKISDDGSLMACVSEHELSVWDVASRTLKAKLQGSNGWLVGVVFTQDGKRLIVSARNQPTRVWDIESKAVIGELSNKANGWSAVATSMDGKWAASGGDGGKILLWPLSWITE